MKTSTLLGIHGFIPVPILFITIKLPFSDCPANNKDGGFLSSFLCAWAYFLHHLKFQQMNLGMTGKKNLTFILLVLAFIMSSKAFSQWSTNGSNIYYNSGNVGIGSNNPNAKLTLYLPGATSSYPTLTTTGDVLQHFVSNNNGIEIGNARSTNSRRAWILARHSQSAYMQYYSSLHLQPDIGSKLNFRGVAIGFETSTEVPYGTHLAVGGKVGIGTLNPDEELTVKGNIHAEEVKVDLLVPGPDYVFKDGYDLKSLEEVQKYIQEHGHLPNIPSA
ncbi:hypothetical protein FOT42_017830, partial [Flagellimonas hadalis]